MVANNGETCGRIAAQCRICQPENGHCRLFEIVMPCMVERTVNREKLVAMLSQSHLQAEWNVLPCTVVKFGNVQSGGFFPKQKKPEIRISVQKLFYHILNKRITSLLVFVRE